MTTSASALPALPPNTDMRKMVERINVLVRWFNRPDLFVPSYAADTGSGTAYVTSPSTDFKVYEVGQIVSFKAANANTGTAPTLNVNGLGAGTITYPDGSALVPGDIAANGFYLAEITSTTPTFALLTAKGNRLLQMVSTVTGAVATGTTVTPFDDTIPQITEGTEFMTLAITPKSSTSKLIIQVIANASHSVGSVGLTVQLHQDATANALAVTLTVAPAATVPVVIPLNYTMTSGTTSATTFRVRIGSPTAGTVTFNGQSGSRIYGGAYASSIVIQEMLP